MARIRPRERRNGSIYFGVYFRELNHETGKRQQTCISWDDYDYADAERCRELIDQLGPDKAREIMKIVQSPRQEQTVRQFLAKHIDHLTGVEAGTTKPVPGVPAQRHRPRHRRDPTHRAHPRRHRPLDRHHDAGRGIR
jgi:hypothetical protein